MHADLPHERGRRKKVHDDNAWYFSSFPPPPPENDRKLEITIREGKTREGEGRTAPKHFFEAAPPRETLRDLISVFRR